MTLNRQHLPKEILVDLLPAAFEPWGNLESRPPTEESIRRIEFTLRLELPPLLVEITKICPSYGGWFNSIGDDYSNHMHIISTNREFYNLDLDMRYVLMTHGYDGDCDAWDIKSASPNNGCPIVYFHYDCDHRILSGLKPLASSFGDYIDAFVRWKAPRCPIKSLRRRAKRILAEHTG